MCLAKIHFNLSNIFQNILRVQYIALLGLIDTYLAKQTFIDQEKVGYCFRLYERRGDSFFIEVRSEWVKLRY